MAIWGGRFSKDADEIAAVFGESLSFDRRLYAQDIKCSVAHVRMLATSKIIDDADASAIVDELGRIHTEIESGDFNFSSECEDIHMSIETCLIDRLGETGARIHAARSRNDQVATDIRLYLRDEIDEIVDLIRMLQERIVALADRHSSVIMPGLTHLQNAQPVLFAHHLLAYVEMLERDSDRLTDCRRRLNRSPLGSGALAGSTLPIDRDQTAAELGFDGPTRNSMDAVSDRDFVIELLADLAIFMMHMSRLSEDIVNWVSQRYTFISLDDAFCTGSSLMPQKKNPDIAELTRGKTGRVYGALIALLTVMKGLPLCYNRDLQEDKEPLFDSIDTAKSVLSIYKLMIDGIEVNADAMAIAASDPFMMATDFVDWLVVNGVPFRSAHEKVGQLVSHSSKLNTSLDRMTLSQIQEVVPEAEEECLLLFTAERSVAGKRSFGGTSPEEVAKQLAYWKKKLASGH